MPNTLLLTEDKFRAKAYAEADSILSAEYPHTPRFITSRTRSHIRDAIALGWIAGYLARIQDAREGIA